MGYQPTKQEMIKEIVKSGKDPVYFINNYAKISHPMRGLIPFRTYPFQDDLLRSFNDHRFNVILKARQLGISTITAAYVVWMMMFHRDKNILVMATKFGTAANLVKKVKHIIRNLPPWLMVATISVDNRTSFELSNGSQIKASSTSADAGRSEALSLLVVDEAAHVEGLDELWTGLYPTLSTGGRCIALSTPNGVGNWFHQTYIDADAGTNDFFPTSLTWDVHPERDQEWFERETRNMSRRQIAQELQCNFNMSGETVLNPDDLASIEADNIIEPEYRTGFDRNLWIWERHNPEHSYLLVADVSRGDGRDYSAFHILDLHTLNQVAEYQGKINLDMYSNLLNTTGREYGDCMLVVENNNIGFAVLEKLMELQYPNLYHSIKSTHEYVDSYMAEARSNAVAGFTTSSKTRPLIIAKLEEFIRNKLLTIRSSRTLNEMKTFIWNNGKPEAMRSYNDDLIMSLAIACWVRDTALVMNQRDTEYKKVFLSSMGKSSTILDTTIPGMAGHKKQSAKDALNERREFAWLLKG
jgi:hypothetical protein